jgi:hypothetical protein
VGLTAGRVRLAGFSSAIGSLVPRAVATLASRHPGLQISLTDTHPASMRPMISAARSASSRPAWVSRMPAANPLQQLRAGLGLEPGQVGQSLTAPESAPVN